MFEKREGKWRVWRECEQAGGNLVMTHSGYPDVRGDSIGATLVKEFDDHKPARAYIEKENLKFLKTFKLKDKRVIKRERIWNGRETVYLDGFTYAFKKYAGLRDYSQIEYDKETGATTKIAYIPGTVRLFNSGRKWWLHYGKGHNTGGFNSRKECMMWFLGDGR